jgi:protein-tyrosine phosphatase
VHRRCRGRPRRRTHRLRAVSGGIDLIDLHCHILSGIDDGALDLADSVAMGRQADRDGVALVCATPHIRHDHDVRIAELVDRVAELNAALEDAGASARVLPGGEVAETIVEHLGDAELRAVTLGGGGRWILLEPRPGPLSDSLPAAVDRLAARGLRCLVAHPERHLAPDLIRRLAALVDRGALVQATAAHVETGPAVEGMLDLARHGVIHVVASDAHSSHGGRPVRLSGALARLAEVERVAPYLEWIAQTAPRAIVAGDDVVAPF